MALCKVYFILFLIWQQFLLRSRSMLYVGAICFLRKKIRVLSFLIFTYSSLCDFASVVFDMKFYCHVPECYRRFLTIVFVIQYNITLIPLTFNVQILVAQAYYCLN